MFYAFLKGENEYNKPFLLIDNTKNEKSSTKIKGVDEDMKNIYKRKDGRYEYSKMIDNERIYIINRSKSELEKQVREIKLKNKKQKNTHLFKNIVLEWYSNFKEPYIKENAKQIYNASLNKHILPKLGNKSINKITFKELQIFINQIDKKRMQEIICQHIKAVFDYAYSNRYININPAIALKLPKKQSKEIIKPLTIEEQQKLLKEIKGSKFETFIIFSLILGTRRNETLAFKIEDINQEKQIIHINGTKTENAERDIKISKDMIQLLLNNNKTQPYFNFRSDYVTKEISKLLKSLGIEKTLHALRHTTATNLFYLGYKDKERQQYLGHANITTTNNIYTYLENDIKKEDIHKLYNNLYYEN